MKWKNCLRQKRINEIENVQRWQWQQQTLYEVSRVVSRNYRTSLRLLHFVSYNQLHTSHFLQYFFSFSINKYIVSVYAVSSLFRSPNEKEKHFNDHFIFNFSSLLLHLIFSHSGILEYSFNFDTLYLNVYLSRIKNTNPQMKFNFLLQFWGAHYRYAKLNKIAAKCTWLNAPSVLICRMYLRDFKFCFHFYHTNQVLIGFYIFYIALFTHNFASHFLFQNKLASI